MSTELKSVRTRQDVPFAGSMTSLFVRTEGTALEWDGPVVKVESVRGGTVLIPMSNVASMTPADGLEPIKRNPGRPKSVPQ
jgi:hypothetical protein